MPHLSDDTQLEIETQLDQLITQQWEQEVLPQLPEGYEQAAKQLGAFERVRVVRCVTDLLRAVLASVLCTSSLRQLGSWAVLSAVADLSHVAWHKRLQRSRDWLCWLLMHLLAVNVAPTTPWSQGAGRVVLVDATRLRQPGGCGDDWRAHLAYDLVHARLVDVRISDQHTAEGFAHFAWLPGDIVVSDRGYCRRPEVAGLLDQQVQITIRFAASSFPVQDARGACLDVVAWLKTKAGTRYERLVSFEHQQRCYHGRLIAQALSPEAAEKARAKVRRRASKKQHQVREDTLFLAGWLLVFTTLPRPQWSAAQVLRLYRARWQIELVIKRMKQVLKLAQLRGKTPQSNEASLFALLVAWALQQDQVSQARQILSDAIAALHEGDAQEQRRTLSSWGLDALSTQTLRVCVQGYWTPARLRACWPRLLRFIWTRRKRPHQETDIRQLLCRQLGLQTSLLFSCSSA